MTIRRLFRVLLGIALVAMGVRETVDPDLWWHLRTGEIILNSGLPRQDPFSYTMAGRPWIAHEWLTDVVMALLHRAGGLPALSLFFAGVVGLGFFLLFLRTPGRPYLAGFLIILGATATSPTWGARPQMINLLLGAWFIYVLEGVRQAELSRRWLWLLPLTSVLWANLHSGYLFGIVLCGVYAVGAGLEQWRTRDFQPLLTYGATGAACLVAALINPQGIHLWFYPFETLGSQAMQQFIAEWQAPDFQSSLFQPFAVFLAVAVLILIFSPQRPTWTELLLFLGGGGAALTSARNIPLFVVATLPFLGRHLLLALQAFSFSTLFTGERPEPRARPAQQVLHWLVIAVALIGAATWAGVRIGNNDAALRQLFPVDALAVIRDEGLVETRVYNRYAWGGYLIWNEIPVFVDGRADVYGDFIYTYLQAAEGTLEWEQPLDTYDVNYVLMHSDSVLVTLLSESEHWRPLYRDDVAAVFVRAEQQVRAEP